jgi:hypothetical protein
MPNQPRITKIQLQGESYKSKLSSDDECVQKLAALLELRDRRNLAEIANLIGRLAVAVE